MLRALYKTRPSWDIHAETTDLINSVFDSFRADVLGSDKFPLYNIYQSKEKIVIALAVAGYSQDRLSVEQEGDTIIIKGKASDESPLADAMMAVNQISNKNWKRAFQLNCEAEITGVNLKDGILYVNLVLVGKKENKQKFEIVKI